MPVQFTCQQCQQRLSVSSRKAGSQVKCPKCQASVLVPLADTGSVSTIAPKAAKVESAAPEPPPAVEFSDLIVYDDVPIFISDAPKVKTDAEPEPSPVPTAEVRVDRSLVSISRRMIYAHAALLLLLTLLGFALGFAIGRTRHVPSEASVKREPVQINGTVSYMSEAGGVVADVGAVVIVLPVDNLPDQNSRFPVAGLHPDDPPPGEDNETVQAIESLDGVYLRSADEGRFDFMVAPGKYRVLIISAHVHRANNTQPQGRDLATLGGYFLPAPDLLGNFQYRLQTLDLPRQAPIDQRFARDGR